MFVDWENRWSPPPPPVKKEPALSKKKELVLIWAVCLFLFLSTVAPIGGASLITFALAVFRR